MNVQYLGHGKKSNAFLWEILVTCFTYLCFSKLKWPYADFLTEIWTFITVLYTIRNLTLYTNFFCHLLSLLMQWGGKTDEINVGKETEKFAGTPQVIFCLN